MLKMDMDESIMTEVRGSGALPAQATITLSTHKAFFFITPLKMHNFLQLII